MDKKIQKIIFTSTLCFKYLNAAEILFSGNIKQGNKRNPCISISPYDDKEEFFLEVTKYNDENIGDPMLYNFYHALELMVKCLLMIKTKKLIKSHFKEDKDITILESEINKEFYDTLSAYLFVTKVKKSLKYIGGFLSLSTESSIVNYNEKFRYSISKKDDLIDNSMIRGKGKEILEEYKKILDDIELLRKEFKKEYDNFWENTEGKRIEKLLKY